MSRRADVPRAEPPTRVAVAPTRLPTDDGAPLTKVAAENKEQHEARLAAGALPLFDLEAYLDDFNATVVGGYATGRGDQELRRTLRWRAASSRPAPPPPVTSPAWRPGSPSSSAMRASVHELSVPAPTAPSLASPSRTRSWSPPWRSSQRPNRSAAGGDERARTLHPTTKYADVPSRKGHEPALFGIFVDPVHCKGCGECVEVCQALGYDALHMIDKLPKEPSGGSTLDRFARDFRLFRSLPVTPEPYRNEGSRRPHAGRACPRLRRRCRVLLGLR